MPLQYWHQSQFVNVSYCYEEVFILSFLLSKSQAQWIGVYSYDEIPVILHSSPITIIPGVGRSLEQQLASMDVSTCGELVSLEEVSV